VRSEDDAVDLRRSRRARKPEVGPRRLIRSVDEVGRCFDEPQINVRQYPAGRRPDFLGYHTSVAGGKVSLDVCR